MNVILLLALIAVGLAALTYISAFQRIKSAAAPKIIFRIGLNYIQMLASLGLFRAQATETFRSLIGVTETVGSAVASAPPFQCLFHWSYFTRFAINLALPFLLVPVSVLCAVTVMYVRHCRSKKQSQKARSHRVMRAQSTDSKNAIAKRPLTMQAKLREYWSSRGFIGPALFVMFLMYNGMSSTVATMFQCRPEEIDGVVYLEADLQVQCYNAAHIGGMVVAAIVGLLFNIGFPVGLYLFLRKREKRLSDPDVFARLGFLYQGYSMKRRMFAWESVVLLRKFLIVVFAATLDDPWFQALAGIGIVAAALFLQLRFHPYDDQLFNRLELLVLLTLGITQVTTLMYLRSESLPLSENQKLTANVIVTIFLLLINGAMLGGLIWSAASHCRQRRRERKRHQKPAANLYPSGEIPPAERDLTRGSKAEPHRGVASMAGSITASNGTTWSTNPISRKER